MALMSGVPLKHDLYGKLDLQLFYRNAHFDYPYGSDYPQDNSDSIPQKLFDEIDERKIHRGLYRVLAASLSSLHNILVLRGHRIQSQNGGAVAGRASYDGDDSNLLLALRSDADVSCRYCRRSYRSPLQGKFLLQIFTGTLLVAGGMWISDLYGFLWIHHCPDWLGWLFSIFLVIYVANSINLIDGIDGLCIRTEHDRAHFLQHSVFFPCRRISVRAHGSHNSRHTSIPFFYYNVFGHAENHNKIFMGDTGSLTIGTVLAFLSIAMFRIPLGDIPGNQNPFILAIAPIILPCFDVVRVFVHRVRNGSNCFFPTNATSTTSFWHWVWCNGKLSSPS